MKGRSRTTREKSARNMKIYNTLSRKKEELEEKKIGIYVCGPTVYDEPHIGHARSAYVFDMIVRYLRFRGLKVRFVRNVTDIDDKIIERARREPGGNSLKKKVKGIAEEYLKRYHEDMELLGLKRPNKEPRATHTIRDIIAFIKILLKKGYAYEVEGNVYFNVRKFEDYGVLSGQSLDQMLEGARVALDKNKKDPLDFALWKASKEDEPYWKSPWGKGRPGWHIECSVMSTKFLKNNFLIHGGGLDLVFPHHENEIAQTVCAGKKSAEYWMHNGLLTINSEKMSKSLGNFITIRNFKKSLDLLKLLFLSSHYRHPVDYTERKIEQSRKARDRILAFLQKVDSVLKKYNKKSPESQRYLSPFTSAMDDDFNTPLAISVIFKCVDDGNKILEKGNLTDEDYKALAGSRLFIRNVAKGVFGLNLDYKTGDTRVDAMVSEREEARKNKDFKKADGIREELLKQGIVVEDTEGGPVWRRRL